jgi:hypothetical protein
MYDITTGPRAGHDAYTLHSDELDVELVPDAGMRFTSLRFGGTEVLAMPGLSLRHPWIAPSTSWSAEAHADARGAFVLGRRGIGEAGHAGSLGVLVRLAANRLWVATRVAPVAGRLPVDFAWTALLVLPDTMTPTWSLDHRTHKHLPAGDEQLYRVARSPWPSRATASAQALQFLTDMPKVGLRRTATLIAGPSRIAVAGGPAFPVVDVASDGVANTLAVTLSTATGAAGIREATPAEPYAAALSIELSGGDRPSPSA